MLRKQIYQRREIFPDDWIKPDEFNFCNKCGYSISLTVSNLCQKCQGLLAWSDIEIQWQQTTINFRNNLAKMRKKAGFPPLFWMIKNEKNKNQI